MAPGIDHENRSNLVSDPLVFCRRGTPALVRRVWCASVPVSRTCVHHSLWSVMIVFYMGLTVYSASWVWPMQAKQRHNGSVSFLCAAGVQLVPMPPQAGLFLVTFLHDS